MSKPSRFRLGSPVQFLLALVGQGMPAEPSETPMSLFSTCALAERGSETPWAIRGQAQAPLRLVDAFNFPAVGDMRICSESCRV